MKLISACVVVALVPAIRAADDWTKVAPEGGKCEIMFPGKAKETDQKGGKQLMVEREGGKAAMLLQFNDIGAIDIKNAEAVKVIMDGASGGLKTVFKSAKVQSEKDFKFNNKYPAREIEMDVPMLGIYRTRFVLTGSKVYQVTVLGPKDYQASAEVKKFLESFKITE
jgi:hypothetical protein